MTFFRHRRFRIGIFLAAIMFAAGALPGLVAAAQGVQIQAPLCSPDATDPVRNSDSHTDSADHCQICPLAGSFAVHVPHGQGRIIGPDRDVADVLPKDGVSGSFVRAELTPLMGRAPPIRG